MFAPYYRLKLIRGDTLDVSFRITGRLGSAIVPANLLGSYLEFTAAWEGGQIIATTPSAAMAISNPSDGLVALHLSAAETLSFPAGGPATFSLRRLSDGRWDTVLYGDIEILALTA